MKKTLLALAFAAALVWFVVATPPRGGVAVADFDPYRLADLEVQMWQAYYDGATVRLFRLLVVTLREQYDYSWVKAVSAAFDLARAASTFAEMQSGYQSVLPDLESAYTTARDWLDASFDPAEVARAELAWWAARRTPGEDRPEQVGALIAEEYALIYGTSRSAMMRAGVLRARAAAQRDREADAPDWDSIASLLTDSYVELHSALNR